jgi:hypothetical protein
MPSRILVAALVALAGWLSALALVGCNDDCSGTYHCPALGGSSILVPSDISARVRSASGDTCTPTVDPTSGTVGIDSSSKRPCRVSLVLDDGTVAQSDVTFVPLHCCGVQLQATPFTPADGGAGG